MKSYLDPRSTLKHETSREHIYENTLKTQTTLILSPQAENVGLKLYFIFSDLKSLQFQ